MSELVYYQEGGSELHVNDIAAMISGDLIDRGRPESLAEQFGVIDVRRQVLERIGTR